jgi:hypothetical protein
MQMYRVKFARRLIGDVVDLGDMIVCAGTQDAARDTVAVLLAIGVSGTEWDISRVKPSIYQVSRREVRNSISTVTADLVNPAFATMATFPGTTENRAEQFWFSVQATARIRAENEEDAIVKLAAGLEREMAGTLHKPSFQDLDIRCDRAELHPRSPAVEKQSIYTDIKIVHGGAGRPR